MGRIKANIFRCIKVLDLVFGSFESVILSSHFLCVIINFKVNLNSILAGIVTRGGSLQHGATHFNSCEGVVEAIIGSL